MVRAFISLSLLTFVFLVGRGVAADSTAVRRERVETGLRPAIVFGEATDEPFRIADRMKFYKVPGVSVAVIEDGEIAWARGYGVCEAGTETPVTVDTLFQGASISKPVAATVVLRLVEQGALDLDEDVNDKLRSWRIPENEFTARTKVSLRFLLSHRAGLTDYAGFHAAPPDQPLPTLRDVLETGEWTPAPVRVGIEPGSRFAYSGGGYCLIEQLLTDVSGKPFPALARELVFDPLGMSNSSFDQDLSPERWRRAAVGHQFNGEKLSQNWNRYSATSAAGLWTTPSDLARLAIELNREAEGSVLSRATVAEMLSVQGPPDDRDSKVIAIKEAIAERPAPAWGLGIGLIGRPPTRFFHSGANPGYQCELHAFLNAGQGAVIMTNGEQGWRLGREILWSIAHEYDWPEYAYAPEIREVATLAANELDRFVGRYRIALPEPSRMTLEIALDGDRLFVRIPGYVDRTPLYPQSYEMCFTVEDAMTLTFVKGEAESFTEVVSDLGWRAARLPDEGNGSD